MKHGSWCRFHLYKCVIYSMFITFRLRRLSLLKLLNHKIHKIIELKSTLTQIHLEVLTLVCREKDILTSFYNDTVIKKVAEASA